MGNRLGMVTCSSIGCFYSELVLRTDEARCFSLGRRPLGRQLFVHQGTTGKPRPFGTQFATKSLPPLAQGVIRSGEGALASGFATAELHMGFSDRGADCKLPFDLSCSCRLYGSLRG